MRRKIVGKKAQAILPFFAVQLVSMMIFLIVLLTLMTMTKNVKFTIAEFDERTSFLLAGRRLVSSADCFAYEERGAIYDSSSGSLYPGARVFPNIVDPSKLLDYENLNCMRKDFYDKENDVINGYWDAANASGGVFKYMIRVVDITNGKDYYYSPSTNNFSTSFIGRVTKTESFTDSGQQWWGDDCSSRYGDWKRIGNCIGAVGNCKEGRCKNNSADDDIGIMHVEEGIKPYWNTTPPAGKCDYTFVSTNVSNFADTSAPKWEQTTWTQSNTTCAAVNNSRSMVMPTMIKVGNELHPAVLYMESCLIFGPKYEGRTLLEIEYKPKVGGQGCV